VNYNVTGTVQSATIAYDWVLEKIGQYEVEKAGQREKMYLK